MEGGKEDVGKFKRKVMDKEGYMGEVKDNRMRKIVSKEKDEDGMGWNEKG